MLDARQWSSSENFNFFKALLLLLGHFMDHSLYLVTRYYSFYGWKNRFTVVQRKFKMFKCFIALCTSKKSRRSSSSGGESLFLKGKKRARKSCAFCGKQHMNALSTFFSILISRQAQSCLNTVNKFNFVEKNVLLKIRTIHSRVEYRPLA